ncbi:MAG: L-2-hydroxyglutarate oxidase [Acidothermus sp.]|nr:L-2-hydroxyglutarate oxidase [Acidothermus sp.]
MEDRRVGDTGGVDEARPAHTIRREDTENLTVDVAVIGGGLVGLAAARAVVQREPACRVVVLEKEDRLAVHQSGRNSGVVHAGVYYRPGSLKARLCTAGRIALAQYAREHDVPYIECGKVVVAVREEEIPALEELYRRSLANGVPDVRLVDDEELRRIEPHARGIAALHSPHTAITDFPAIARCFADEIRRAGGSVLTGFRVVDIAPSAHGVALRAADGRKVRATRVLICAGLYGDRLAVMAGDRTEPRIVPFRGDYYRLAPSWNGRVRGLIYPVPDPSLPFLGVHVTPTVSGEILVGPNAVLAGAREGYRWTVVRPRELVDVLSWPGFWPFAARYWRVGIAEVRRAVSRRRFARDVGTYLDAVSARDLLPARAGVRAQAMDRSGALVDDFVISRLGPVVAVRNAPSPAATSSMPIGEELAKLVFADGDDV